MSRGAHRLPYDRAPNLTHRNTSAIFLFRAPKSTDVGPKVKVIVLTSRRGLKGQVCIVVEIRRSRHGVTATDGAKIAVAVRVRQPLQEARDAPGEGGMPGMEVETALLRVGQPK